MPYFQDPNLDDDNETVPGQLQISGASPTSEPDGMVSQGSGQKGLQTGSGFQNLDKYLQTNNAQQFGQKVLGNVQSEVQGAKAGMQDATQKFKSQVAESNQLPTSEQVNSAIANPTGADPKAFQTWQSQTYKGPNSLADSNDAFNQYWSGINKAGTTSKQLGSEAGRFTLLDSYFGKPNYSFGEKSLDNLLVQQSGLGKQTRGLQNEATQLKTQGNQNSLALQNEASQRAGQVEQSKNATRAAIGLDAQGNVIQGEGAGAIGKEYDSATQALKDANIARRLQQSQMKQNLGYDNYNNLTQEQIAMLGLGNNTELYNLDLSNYLQTNPDLTINQSMSPEQRARIQALSQLAGVDDSFASGAALDPTDPYSINADKLRNDQTVTAANYDQGVKDIGARLFRSFNVDPNTESGKMTARKWQNPTLETLQGAYQNYLQQISKGIDVGDGVREFVRDFGALEKTYNTGRKIAAPQTVSRPARGPSVRPGVV